MRDKNTKETQSSKFDNGGDFFLEIETMFKGIMHKKFKKHLLFGFDISLEGQLMGCQNRVPRALLVNVFHVFVLQRKLKSIILQILEVVKAVALIVV